MTKRATDVLDALERHVFREPAEIMLRNVRNKTGWKDRGPERYADALAISVYPSRGIWFAGVEVKVSRPDWLRELRDPAKSDAVQRYCDYWWVAAPPGVVDTGELPKTWGLVVIDGDRVNKVVPAPKLAPTPLIPEFVASVLRNIHAVQANERTNARDEGYAIAAEKLKAKTEALAAREKRLAVLERELAEYSTAKAELAALRADVAAFEKDSGVNVTGYVRGRSKKGEAIRAALAAAEAIDGAAGLALRFRTAAEQLEIVAKAKAEGFSPASLHNAPGNIAESLRRDRDEGGRDVFVIED